MPTGAIVTEETKCFQADLKPTPKKGTHIWYCEPSQKPVVGEVIGPRGEAAAVILLSGHDMPIKFPSELSLSNIVVCLSALMRETSFCTGQCQLVKEMRISDILMLSHKWYIYITPQCPGNITEQRAKKKV